MLKPRNPYVCKKTIEQIDVAAWRDVVQGEDEIIPVIKFEARMGSFVVAHNMAIEAIEDAADGAQHTDKFNKFCQELCEHVAKMLKNQLAVRNSLHAVRAPE